MSDINEVLAEAVRRESERIEPPPREQAVAASRRGRSRRRTRGIATVIGAAVLVGGIALPIMWLSPLAPEGESPPAPTPAASPSTSQSIEPPDGPGPFHPHTYREGASRVMPVTFPDGTSLELVYPTGFPLAHEGVYPKAYVENGPQECHPEVTGARSTPGWTRADPGAPLAVFDGADGRSVGYWRGLRNSAPWNVLALDLGPWVPYVLCEANPETDAESLATWARALDAYETEDGFLVFTPHRPLRLLTSGFHVGPVLQFEDDRAHDERNPRGAFVELTLRGCSWDEGLEFSAGVGQWCLQPGGIAVYAQARYDLALRLYEGLASRNLERPAL